MVAGETTSRRSDRRTIVVALGGHAIVRRYQRGTVTEQFANARASLAPVTELVAAGHRVVVTHGNGPQVGAILMRVEAARDSAYELPLGVCVAESQGEMGYMIQQTLQNQLMARGIDRETVTVVTQVLADENDPSLLHPIKPIGPVLDGRQIRELRERDVVLANDPGRGMRRLVPSPVPIGIVEIETIRRLLEHDTVVIAAGGGGMPVYRMPDGRYEGIDAVVDKDLASRVLANAIDADDLIILTELPRVALDFGGPDQRWLDRLTVGEARTYAAEGHFPPGSMGPKIRACVEFVDGGGQRAIIADPENLTEALHGRAGTTVVADGGG
jgi:carbamate kinase